jgi:hypothetical protein
MASDKPSETATMTNCLIERDIESLVSITKLMDKSIAIWFAISLFELG